MIRADNTESPVDLDQVLNSFTPKVTKGLQDFSKGSAAQYADDPSTPLNETTYGNHGPALGRPVLRRRRAPRALGVAKDDETLASVPGRLRRARPTTLAGQKEQIDGDVHELDALHDGGFGGVRGARQGAGDPADDAAARARWPSSQLRPTFAALENLSDKSDPIGENDGDGLAPLFRKLKPLVDNAEPTLEYLRVHDPQARRATTT